MGQTQSRNEKALIAGAAGGVASGAVGAAIFGPIGLIGFLLGAVVVGGATYLIVAPPKQNQAANVIQGQAANEPQGQRINILQGISDFQMIKLTSKQIDEISSISSQSFRKLLQNYTCPITKRLIRQPVTLSCSHLFQKISIQKWVKQKKQCPSCRQPASVQDIRKDIASLISIQNVRLKALKSYKKRLEEFEGLDVTIKQQVIDIKENFRIMILKDDENQ